MSNSAALQPPAPATERPSAIVEFRTWLEANWDASLSLVAWRQRLTDAGWAAPHWPTRWYGRDLAGDEADAVARELARAGAIGLPPGPAATLAGPTILEHGPDSLRERFLRPILTGEETWCQLFSEPGAGSDLAGVTTTAVRDGDEWVVSGQKLWNTSAHHADYGILIARTDWDAPKHRGLTYFVLPMRQAGVDVRPLRQMNGYSSFNEVFISEARIPADHIVGDVGDGWRVALTTLAFERRFGGIPRPAIPDTDELTYREARVEAEENYRTYEWYPQRAGRVDLLIDQARAAGLSDDPIIRQEIARVLSLQRVSQWTSDRARSARALGRSPGAEGSIGKLSSSAIARAAADVHTLLIGAGGLLSGADAPLDGVISEVLISVPAQSIAGGTDEIQKNILGERVLGLPREPSLDRDVAFRDVPRNA